MDRNPPKIIPRRPDDPQPARFCNTSIQDLEGPKTTVKLEIRPSAQDVIHAPRGSKTQEHPPDPCKPPPTQPTISCFNSSNEADFVVCL